MTNYASKDAQAVGAENFFPTQKSVTNSNEIPVAARALGAPFGPVPASFLILPDALKPCRDIANAAELSAARSAREAMKFDNYNEAYMDDIVRAFRLLRGAHVYIEVGTFDRGNLAYVATLLADDALIIGVDVQMEASRDDRLRRLLKPGQTYVPVIGDSRHPDTVAAVTSALGGRLADAVFIDGDHTAYGAMCDYVNFGGMVKRGGYIMTHDSLWEGDADYKGVADTLAEIDRLEPIYLVPGFGQCYRFMRPLWRQKIWGVVGIHVQQ